ncbi:hypothetical protein Scep_010578 [Stephania cephalantha]|uniref:Uncharacterized protein n=1 Tax=Stephania cephalantha TaxID=152367 RepID=A0AAP0JXS1_9MAGN
MIYWNRDYARLGLSANGGVGVRAVYERVRMMRPRRVEMRQARRAAEEAAAAADEESSGGATLGPMASACKQRAESRKERGDGERSRVA